MTVLKTNASTPTNTEPTSKVNSTLMATLPQRMVVSSQLASSRITSTRSARLSPPLTATCSSSRLRLKKARFRPENMAD